MKIALSDLSGIYIADTLTFCALYKCAVKVKFATDRSLLGENILPPFGAALMFFSCTGEGEGFFIFKLIKSMSFFVN